MHNQFTPNKVILKGETAMLEVTRRLGDSIYAIIDKEDLGSVLAAGRWTADPHGYIVCNNIRMKLHRFVIDAPDGSIVDHINHKPADCRKSNLRIVTHAENMQNRKGPHKNCKSGVRNVYWDRHKLQWVVRVRANGVIHHIGSFASIKEAESAAIQARARLHAV